MATKYRSGLKSCCRFLSQARPNGSSSVQNIWNIFRQSCETKNVDLRNILSSVSFSPPSISVQLLTWSDDVIVPSFLTALFVAFFLCFKLVLVALTATIGERSTLSNAVIKVEHQFGCVAWSRVNWQSAGFWKNKRNRAIILSCQACNWLSKTDRMESQFPQPRTLRGYGSGVLISRSFPREQALSVQGENGNQRPNHVCLCLSVVPQKEEDWHPKVIFTPVAFERWFLTRWWMFSWHHWRLGWLTSTPVVTVLKRVEVIFVSCTASVVEAQTRSRRRVEIPLLNERLTATDLLGLTTNVQALLRFTCYEQQVERRFFVPHLFRQKRNKTQNVSSRQHYTQGMKRGFLFTAPSFFFQNKDISLNQMIFSRAQIPLHTGKRCAERS